MNTAKNNGNFDLISKFGLNINQTKILFSIQKLIVEKDISISKNKNNKKCVDKEMWLREWSQSILDYLCGMDLSQTRNFYNRYEVKQSINNEMIKSPHNKTWYYIVILEATLFAPYTPLEKDKDNDKKYNKLKFNKQTEYIKEFVAEHSIINVSCVERFEGVYSKTLSKLKGIKSKILISVVSVLAIVGLVAALASVFVGSIAVAIFGSQFVGLSGAALTSACLAAAGGGAIAAGGAGMAGGVAVIVGGGALLGLAGGGVAVGGINMLVAATPDFTLTQAAKLEVVLKEIILNSQKDIRLAQSVLSNYKEQINKLNLYIKDLELKIEKDKKMIKNLKKSLEYMEKVYKDANIFTSSFDIGLDNEE